MKHIKKYLGSIFVLLIACLSIGSFVSASNSTSTEVQIAIEASDFPRGNEGVKTRDDKNIWEYMLAIGAAVLMGVCALVHKKHKGLVAVLVLFLSLFFVSHSAHAAEPEDNVSVTVPSSITVAFEETGKNSISDFCIRNESLVPIFVDKVKVVECNGWKLCDSNVTIPVNTKQLSFVFDGQCLKAGENVLGMTIEEHGSKNCDIQIGRGAWTSSKPLETAMKMEFEYRIEEKHNYAIYIEEDKSLRFIQSADEVTSGSSYKGMTVTNVFTGFDTETYSALKEIPWYDGDWYDTRSIKKVIVEDVIQPMSTAYWFYHLHELEYIDVSKLDLTKVTDMSYTFYKIGWKSPGLTMVGFDKLNTSNVTNMTRTFCYAGQYAPSFVVDISSWDVSNVTTMYRMFNYTGYNSTTFSLGELGKWDVSNVTNMFEMFINAGYNADWYMDLSGWNVSKVTTHTYFNSGIGSKIGEPHWVN